MQREMRAGIVVVGGICLDHTAEMLLAKNDHVIKAFTPD
jgi:hypothetical protein